MKIREAIQEDIPELTGIIKEVFDEFNFFFDADTELPDFVDFNKHYRNSDNVLFVIEHKNSIAGCGALKLDDEGGVISRVYLRKKFRGLGLGKNLVRHLIHVAKTAGVSHLSLWTDTRFTVAHNLYTSLGFVRTEKQRPLHDVNASYEIYFEMKLQN